MNLPPIFCITLPEEPWKRDAAARHFENVGIRDSVQFVYGTQGVTIGMKPTNPYDFDPNGAALYIHSSQLGAVVSHRAAIATALAQDLDEFIICEDDVLFHPALPVLWPDWRSKLPGDVETVQLEWLPPSKNDGRVMTQIDDRVSTCVPYLFGAACILWSHDAAELALSLLKPVDRPYDTMLIQRVYPFMRHYIANPPLASQRTAHSSWPSSISGAPKEDHRLLG